MPRTPRYWHAKDLKLSGACGKLQGDAYANNPTNTYAYTCTCVRVGFAYHKYICKSNLDVFGLSLV